MEFKMFYEKEDHLPELILTIGIPGSGKDYWIKQFNSTNKYSVITPDEIRKELTGSISDQSQNRLVWKIAKEKVVNNLKNGINTILNATNVDGKNRRNFIKDLPPCKLLAKIIHSDPEISKKRIANDINTKVDRSDVPPEVVDRMYKKFKDINTNVLDREGFTII